MQDAIPLNPHVTEKAIARNRARFLSLGVAAIAVSALAGCGGGSGADTTQNPAGPPSGGSSYSGPAPATADIQSFKINLYDNIVSNNRCGSCHSVEGGQAPMFARSDHVNLPYSSATT